MQVQFDYLDFYCQTSAVDYPKNPTIVLTNRLHFRSYT